MARLAIFFGDDFSVECHKECKPIGEDVTMPVGLLGRKVGMTQVYSADGKLLPVTVIEANAMGTRQSNLAFSISRDD